MDSTAFGLFSTSWSWLLASHVCSTCGHPCWVHKASFAAKQQKRMPCYKPAAIFDSKLSLNVCKAWHESPIEAIGLSFGLVPVPGLKSLAPFFWLACMQPMPLFLGATGLGNLASCKYCSLWCFPAPDASKTFGLFGYLGLTLAMLGHGRSCLGSSCWFFSAVAWTSCKPKHCKSAAHSPPGLALCWFQLASAQVQMDLGQDWLGQVQLVLGWD